MLVSSQKSFTPDAACCESTSVSIRLFCNTSPSSCTVISNVGVLASVALAVMVTVLLPSGKLSSTALTSKFALVWFAGIVTVAGTVASVMSLELRFTTRSLAPLVARPTVPVAGGLVELSEKDDGVTLREREMDGPEPPKVRPVTPGEPMLLPPEVLA